MGFTVYKEKCQNCLLSKDSIVSPERRKDIIQETTRDQSFFVCHKSSFSGGNTCCKEFYDKLGHTSQLIRIAERLGAVKFVEQEDKEKLTSYNEIKNTCS